MVSCHKLRATSPASWKIFALSTDGLKPPQSALMLSH